MSVWYHTRSLWKPWRVVSISVLCCFGLMTSEALSQANYSGQTLTNNNFLGKDLTNADFTNATLNGVVFANATLRGARFDGAIFGDSDLGGTSFASADLTDVSFKNADFATQVDFQYATLTGTDFTAIRKSNALFGPVLDFALNHPPLFKGVEMDCEFPWYFGYLGIEKSDCETEIKTKSHDKAASNPSNDTASSRQSSATWKINTDLIQPNSPQFEPDGSTSSAIYVSKSGTDSDSCGTSYTNPCATIPMGVRRCSESNGACSVNIKYDNYRLNETLELVDGVSLHGGFNKGKASTYYQSNIYSPGGGAAVISASSGVTSTLSNLILTGSHSNSADSASVVLRIIETDNITLRHVNIAAASGGAAEQARDASNAEDGVDGGRYYTTSTSYGNTTVTFAAGRGGASRCNYLTTGGDGGAANTVSASCTLPDPNYCTYPCSLDSSGADAESGYGGQAYAGNPSNPDPICTYQISNNVTPSGENGTDGGHGKGQAEAARNRIGNFDLSNGRWSPVRSESGPDGQDAGGGGGGGTSSPAFQMGKCTNSTCTVSPTGMVKSAPGGGGGSGGCGAFGGEGGSMGGASFGIVLVNSSLTIDRGVQITGAQGGRGGDGGSGAKGGTGGRGGAGGMLFVYSNPLHQKGTLPWRGVSGNGGNGGNGGASGGGAGGNGGPSVGIVLIGSSKYSQGLVAIYPGSSGDYGAGGSGYGSITSGGANGQPGLAQATFKVQN